MIDAEENVDKVQQAENRLQVQDDAPNEENRLESSGNIGTELNRTVEKPEHTEIHRDAQIQEAKSK